MADIPSRILPVLAVAFLSGCGSPTSHVGTVPTTREDRAAAGPDRSVLAKPDPLAIQYTPATRTLELSHPPVAGARWLLVRPTEPRGVPVDGVYQFPETADPDLDATAVCYRTRQGRTSPQVTLREIVAAREYPISR